MACWPLRPPCSADRYSCFGSSPFCCSWHRSMADARVVHPAREVAVAPDQFTHRLECLLAAQILPPCCEAKLVHMTETGISSTHERVKLHTERVPQSIQASVSDKCVSLSWLSSLASLCLKCCTCPVVRLLIAIIDLGEVDKDSTVGCCVSHQLCEACPPCAQRPAAPVQGLSPWSAGLPPRPRVRHVPPGPLQTAASSGQTCRRRLVRWKAQPEQVRVEAIRTCTPAGTTL